MTGAGISCVECGGEYEATDETGVFECEECGHELHHESFVDDVVTGLQAEGFDDLAKRVDKAAKRLPEASH